MKDKALVCSIRGLAEIVHSRFPDKGLAQWPAVHNHQIPMYHNKK